MSGPAADTLAIANEAFLADVIAGLSQPQKAIPARWFYDVRGSELFEAITRLPEYYPTRTEIGLLGLYSDDVGTVAGQRVVVEFGSGSSRKTPLLLDAIDALAYVPIDISGEYLREAAEALAAVMPGLDILPLEGDFTAAPDLPERVRGQPALGFFPGSTIGNHTADRAAGLLQQIGRTLGPDALLLIGIDRVKPLDTLIAAYDDAQGVTAQFNLNLLHRINRELDADVPIERFRHLARWNGVHNRIEMHLEALAPMRFSIAGRPFSMAAGETIHSENSHKYTPEEARLLLRAGGWTPMMDWTDDAGLFGLYLARRTPSSIQD